MELSVEVKNIFQIRAEVSGAAGFFAFQLLQGSEIVERRAYAATGLHVFGVKSPGVYRVKCFQRDNDGTVRTAVSGGVRVHPFVEEPPVAPEEPIAIAGTSRLSAFARLVFAAKSEVRCFVDTEDEFPGRWFFDLPVRREPPDGHRLIGPMGYGSRYPDLEGISLRSGSYDPLSVEFHRHSAMSLYRISRAAYLGGMERGAHAIEMFILSKYSSRIPYRAVIGEGTNLGLGGLGIAIHPRSVIGRDCVIAQNVTLGSRQGGNGTPVVGDNVFIGPGAVCLGGSIGDQSVVGAGAVVLSEVPERCVVAGVPARVISRDVSDYRSYTHRTEVKGL
ncbi:serine O-acetyltransferase [Brachybacterium tyrofermentans]|uniref:serine O-acetyltransferase n=1 Tax=Brachybacterium tyrofermentans TaxID=47848 RepID=UPI003FCF2A82